MSASSAGPGFDRAVAVAMLVAVAAAAGLEGGVVRVYGGSALALAVAVATAWIAVRGVDPLPRLAVVGFGVVTIGWLWQVFPVPHPLRSLVAPGQAAQIAAVAPGWGGDLHGWLSALAEHDLLVAAGLPAEWRFDVLAGAGPPPAFRGTLAPDEFWWTLAQYLALAVVWAAGVGLGRSTPATRIIQIGLILLCLAEAVFGIANRAGGTTGIGVRTAYLGSATGTFVNRGHFAALLVMGLGCIWGLAASLFPLLSEQVRRHRARRTRSSQPPSVFEASGDRLPRLAFLGFLAAVLLIGMVASQARGPLLGFAASAAAVGGWMAWRRGERFHLGIALAAPVVGGALGLLAFGVGGAFGRFRALFSGGDASVTSRWTLWQDSLVAWADAPLFGAGLGGFSTAHTLRESVPHLFGFPHAHNEVVEILVEQGVVGLAGWALVGAAAFLGLRRALATLPHDSRTAAGVGALVAVVAVGLQSLVDFPLHIPGVALPWALLGGMAQGALTTPARVGDRRPVYVIAAFAAALCAWVAVEDAPFVGSRRARLSERGPLWADPARESAKIPSVAAWVEKAEDRQSARPLDPWTAAAVAEGRSRLAAAAWRDGGARPSGSAPEDHALRAELAIARASRLRPRDPYLLLSLGQAYALLGRHAPTADSFRARAESLLVQAVALDAWRIEEALSIAATLPTPALTRIADACVGTPREVARVRTALGKALERRKERVAAREAYAAAVASDARYGPGLFAAGVLARSMGDTAGAEDLLRRFVSADERPLGMEGWGWLLLGELDQAEMRLRRVVQQSPTNRWAWEGIAEIARQRGKLPEERDALKRILALDPSHAAARARLSALDAP
jgi:O-antigen ligase/tetratricopeptide (TPR) repeat protein